MQVLFHGYAGTSGGAFMHHFITDRIAVTPELSPLFTEKLLLMPNSFFLWEDYGDPLPIQLQKGYTAPNLEEHLPGDAGFLFACFNNLYKVSPKAFGAWSKILKSVPDSTLWMIKMPPGAEERLWKEASSKGIPQKRLVMSDLFDMQHHLKVKSGAALFLDTFVYNAHSSACDSLAAGVPLLTMPGDSMPSRVGASLAYNAGMSLLVSNSLESLSLTTMHHEKWM
jgi:protein O-GlcNAc transferase